MDTPEQHSFDMRTSNRDPEAIRLRLTDWFAHALGPDSKPRLSSLTSPGKAGGSSETLLFDMSWRENGVERSGRFVGRLPPPSDAFPLFPRYDFDLQVGVMRLVGSRSGLPVPKVPWQERSTDALGVPFFVMERVDGEMVPDNPLYVFGGWLVEASQPQQMQVQQELVRILAGIHGIKATPAETAFLQIDAPGDTPLRRHFAHKKAFYEWARGELRFSLIESLMDWLQAHWPETESEAVICWGDARPANILWQDCKATAVLDWEMAMMGPREMDVGYLIFFHRYFHHVAKVMAGMDSMPDFLRRDDVVAAYEKMTGVQLQDIDWFITYGLFHQAVIETRLSQRRIMFGEMERPADVNEYIYCRQLIQQVLDGRQNVWS